MLEMLHDIAEYLARFKFNISIRTDLAVLIIAE